MSLDLESSLADGGLLSVGIREMGLGSTAHAYEWDWQTGHYPSRDFSFVDLTKLTHESGAIVSWDVEMAVTGRMRLKVWRDAGDAWQVAAQTDLVTAAPGLNHFVPTPLLAVKPGGYVGLYLEEGGLKLSPNRKSISLFPCTKSCKSLVPPLLSKSYWKSYL